ncbi:MAG: hypothetical protein WC869_16155 [Phycisphaerae bacterium]
MAITGLPNRRAELTASARQQANPQAAPTQQNTQPTQQAAQPSGGSSSGTFYGGMGGGMGNDAGSFYSSLGGGMSRPSQTRMAQPAPIASAPQPQAQQSPGLWEGPQNPGPATPVPQYPGGSGASGAPAPTPSPMPQPLSEADFITSIQQKIASGGLSAADIVLAKAMFPGNQGLLDAVSGALNGLPFNYAPVTHPGYGDIGTPDPVAPPQTTPPFTMPSQSLPSNPQRNAPVQTTNPPDMVTTAPPPRGSEGQKHPRTGAPTGPRQGGKEGGGVQNAPRSGVAPAAVPEYRSVYDRPDFNYSPTPQYGRDQEVLYGTGGGQTMENRNPGAFSGNIASQMPGAGAQTLEMRNPQLTPQLMARIQQLRDMARQQQMLQRAQQAPRFAFGTDNSAQYQQNGMGNSWIPSTSNSYAQGKEIPPALQRLIDMGMPIPPALLNSVTGGQSGPLNMASAFTARGGGSLPSMQGMDRMSMDEREAFGGYLTGPIGMPEASTMDSIGRPTSNLQPAARSRIG